MNALAAVWKALADPTRRRVLDLLREQPRTTGELCARFRHLSRFGVMKHLAVLQDAGLVIAERHGREVHNHLNAVPLQQMYERWIRPYEAHWASSLLRLKRKVERDQGGIHVMDDEKTNGAEIRSMQIEQEIEIQGTPARVFEVMTKEVAAWWGTPYHIGQSPRELILEAKLGGRFAELWGDGEGALWATVTAIRRGELLELSGPIGMSGAVQGVATLRLTPRGNGTSLRLSHSFVGQVTDQARDAYARGWQDLLGTRLKSFVETGKRYGLGCEPPPGIAADASPC